MHILFIGYGKTSQRVAQYLFEQDSSKQRYKITTISRSTKTDVYGNHLIQDVHHLDLNQLTAVDLVYVALSPSQSSVEAYRHTYLDSVEPIVRALKSHPIQRIVVVSSTRVYGEHRGERVDDASPVQPIDEQGQILHDMELKWQTAYPEQTVIIRPAGIYGQSITRMVKMAQTTRSYANIHYTNRIHINDLARFLAVLATLQYVDSSYIVTNNQPLPLHEIIQWFQQQLHLPLVQLSSRHISGKRLYPTRMLQTGFTLKHPVCFNDYTICLQQHSQNS
ncbi:NAD-dependent epimerase/dehydratase family protein [Acinetobacter sp. S40]|uniref:NAD-dependent epimerase/dehydratase family protein n=1 Tax=Acinetobacter sp. S40 TaxID=2767434 RepID=UPI00190D576B|nr:NAD-dependent epimerase/dehydratase family protein [Acinetobacter sp. S40]MBJ9986235.1 NAD-dependent epimerase/dehydratase family protein [Acinetobacter sp. S40]